MSTRIKEIADTQMSARCCSTRQGGGCGVLGGDEPGLWQGVPDEMLEVVGLVLTGAGAVSGDGWLLALLPSAGNWPTIRSS
jgi:hypothetical protein